MLAAALGHFTGAALALHSVGVVHGGVTVGGADRVAVQRYWVFAVVVYRYAERNIAHQGGVKPSYYGGP